MRPRVVVGMVGAGEKVCAMCMRKKRLAGFGTASDKRYPNRKGSYCLECLAHVQRARYARTREGKKYTGAFLKIKAIRSPLRKGEAVYFTD